MGLARMWINQPSNLQPHHNRHGQNVLVPVGSNGKLVKYGNNVEVYLTSGPDVSVLVDALALSDGWIGDQGK
jgi:hypothetical protein